MADPDLFFSNSDELFGYARELQQQYPPGCTDRLGNTCNVVQLQTLEIAERVDNGALSQQDASALAVDKGKLLSRDCTYGISSSLECGLGILCILGPRE